MSNKRAYSAYLSSASADMLVAANGFGAPQLQAQQHTPSSISHLRIPGGWPQDHLIAAEEVIPPRASLFTTLGKWAATVSVANLLSLPARLANRYLRRETIKAIPIISATGSNKKRFISAGLADEECATPSPSVRARANQARREHQRQARASELSPNQFRVPPIQYTSSAHTQEFEEIVPGAYNRDVSLDEGSNVSLEDDEDLEVSVDFSFEDVFTSTPPRDPQTGSPMTIFWNSPQVASPAVASPASQVLSSPLYHYDSPAYDNANPAWISELRNASTAHASSGLTSPSAQALSSSQASASPAPNGKRTSNLPTVTPLRRQLVKAQMYRERKRIASLNAALESTEEGFADTEQAKNSFAESFNQNPFHSTNAWSSTSPSQPKTETEAAVPDFEYANDLSFLPEVTETSEVEYANDLSFLVDAPSPPRAKGVRWEKDAKCKPFYVDTKVSEMLDSTLETITSSPIREYHNVFQNNDGGASNASQASSSSRSSADSSPQITLLDSPAQNGGWRGVSVDAFDAPDESLLECEFSLELLEDLQREMQRKLALAPPPPPPQKPLVAPLTPEEEAALQDAAAKTKYGRKPDQFVIHDKLYARDFATLLPRVFNGDPRAWLNDSIVNEYLSILIAAKKKEMGFTHQRNGPAPPLHAFSSFWYQTADTSRWTNRFQLKGKQYLDADLLLYPICDRGHWRLLAVYPRERTIEYFDSMGLDGQTYIDKLVKYLEQELGEYWVPSEWNKETGQRSEQQKNGSDCGVFTLLNALTLIRGDAPTRVLSTDGMDDARKRIATTLLAGRPTTELE
ncbi:uncharacterized protein J4E79_008815 [Alternaria viburni]|uniref:uncharacterized protein n=1 Tax=Alternaria viburni TaxID=566460 RepID=UPI0020C28874|nr:uncharacterized protein J4E79_008815 [Alternaria viburni]KAI4652509.1 hypothetical protein J4E79_008815 [Alternaria viburni]